MPRSPIVKHCVSPEQGLMEVYAYVTDPDAGSYINGYYGPADLVRSAAVADNVEIPLGRPEQHVGVLVKVWVDLEHRQTGHGKALVRHFMSLLYTAGVEAIYLITVDPEDDIDLIGWYGSEGFTRLDPNSDDLEAVMVRSLNAGPVRSST
jgi:ribosomal protein S18 acetylase RimI-like enzyme